MSWSDDMRCLYCDGKLPLYRKITSGQFCSTAHRKSYWQEQERLAVERLHQTHDSLRAYRPVEPIESVLGQSALSKHSASDPLPAGHFYASPEPVFEIEEGATVEARARSAANTGSVKFAGFLTEARPAPRTNQFLFLAAVDLAAAVDYLPWPSDGCWMLPHALTALAGEFEQARRVSQPLFPPAVSARVIRRGMGEWAPFESNPVTRIGLNATLETAEFQPEFLQRLAEASAVVEAGPAMEPQPERLEEPPVPFAESLFALPRIAARTSRITSRMQPPETLHAQPAPQMTRLDARLAQPEIARATALLPLQLGNTPRTQQISPRADAPQAEELTARIGGPLMTVGAAALAPMLGLAPGRRYPMTSRSNAVAESNPPNVNSVRPMDLRTDTASPQREQHTPDLEPSLSLAPACPYHVSIQASRMSTGAIRAIAPQPDDSPTKFAIVPLPAGMGMASRAPAFRGMLPLEFHATPRIPDAAQPVTSGVLNQYPANEPMLPVAQWQPIEGGLAAPARKSFLGWTPNLTGSREGTNVLSQAADFWQHAPRDLKLLVVAIPVLLGLALRPSLPKVRVTAPTSGTQIQGTLERGLRAQLRNVRRTVADRAGVALNEEFRSGLDDWQSRGDLSTAWSFDYSGFVRPGPLALYRPSMGLRDYELQFLGLINKKALSWVVRAADFDNYYVVKLVVTKPGPLPAIGITRYAVINGQAQKQVNTVAAINARPDMLYRVSLNISESTYLLTLQGIVVDTWTEPRLKTGGVGFFSARGEESRLRWVQVTHQYDMLGRLCAYLAPYNIPNTNGSW